MSPTKLRKHLKTSAHQVALNIMRSILANLGFILQSTGVFVLFPAIYSLVDQQLATIGLLVTAVCFFAFGFVLNALCERKDISFRAANWLILLSFAIMAAIGSIPYLFNVFTSGTLLENVTNAYFESISGFTTTGLSLISVPQALPVSLLLYRSMTQFIGGVGIVLLLLVLFYPEEKLVEFSRSMGLDFNSHIKRTFLITLAVYFVAGLIIGIGVFFSGITNIPTLISLVFSTISTGGFFSSSQGLTDSSISGWLIFGMILGATNFFAIMHLTKLKIVQFIKSEALVFFAWLGIIIFITFFFFKDVLNVFHVISAATTTGFQFIDLSTLSDGAKLFLIGVMFIGGTSLSTAGGIRIVRLLLIGKAITHTTSSIVAKKETPIVLFGKQYHHDELIVALSSVIVISAIILFATVGFYLNGMPLIDSAFDVVSAITCTGLSTTVVGISSTVATKWIFIALMFIGRVEIFTVFFAFSFFVKEN